MENNSPFLNNYLFGEKIGSGGFSSVYKAIHLPTKIPVAIKMLTKQKFPIDKLRRELKIMELLDHPYTISLFEFIEDSNFFYIVMEYINGMSLYKLITNSGPLPEPTIKKYLVQVLSVLDYIHNDLHIAHRDIKPENIMIDENDNIRIIDFGLGNVFDSETFLKTACGSPGMYFFIIHIFSQRKLNVIDDFFYKTNPQHMLHLKCFILKLIQHLAIYGV